MQTRMETFVISRPEFSDRNAIEERSDWYDLISTNSNELSIILKTKSATTGHFAFSVH